MMLGLALALSEWRSKLGFGTLTTSLLSAATTVTADKFENVKRVIEGASLLTPLLATLNIFLATFVLTLLVSAGCVLVSNFAGAHAARQPDALGTATRKAVAVLGYGVLHYATRSPDRIAEERITELTTRNTILWLLQKTLVGDVAGSVRGDAHFVDVVKAMGHMVLQYSFGDGADLQHYRMAFFELRGSRLEYMVTVNNGDWTAHSGNGFDVGTSFMGEALRSGKPLIFPKDKRFRSKFAKRKSARYESFIAIPVPCDHGGAGHIGVVTVDSTSKSDVFTASRVQDLVAFSQIVHALYRLNRSEVIHGGAQEGLLTNRRDASTQ